MNPFEGAQKLDASVVGLGLDRFGGDLDAWWELPVKHQVDILAHLEVVAERTRPQRGTRDPDAGGLARLRERALAQRDRQ